MTYTEKKELPLGVGDDVKHYDDGKDGHPKKMATGKVTEVGEFTFLVKWDDLEDETEYEWHKVTIEGSQIIEQFQPPVSGKEVEEVAKIVDYCISKLDTELLKSRQEFHRLVAIKECIKSYPTPIKEAVTDGVEFADWKDNNYIKHPNGYYSKFNDGSFGKSHLTPKFHTLTELYTLFQKSKNK